MLDYESKNRNYGTLGLLRKRQAELLCSPLVCCLLLGILYTGCVTYRIPPPPSDMTAATAATQIDKAVNGSALFGKGRLGPLSANETGWWTWTVIGRGPSRYSGGNYTEQLTFQKKFIPYDEIDHVVVNWPPWVYAFAPLCFWMYNPWGYTQMVVTLKDGTTDEFPAYTLSAPFGQWLLFWIFNPAEPVRQVQDIGTAFEYMRIQSQKTGKTEQRWELEAGPRLTFFTPSSGR